MKLTWLGRSCFQLTTQYRTRIIFDPYFDLYRERLRASFPPPEMICVSHGHLDHFSDVPDLVRGDSPALVVAIPHLCRALRELMPETQHRLFPIPWDDQVEVEGVHFYAFRSPPMETSLYDMIEEFGAAKVLDFLQACRQLADDILYLPLTSFGVETDGLRVLHFVAENGAAEDGVDVGDIGARFSPDVALVSVNPGEEERSAEYAAALGAPLVIPHHYRAYGNLPAADLDVFAQRLDSLGHGIELRVMEEMKTINL